MTGEILRQRVYLNVYGSRYTFGLQGDGATPVTADTLITRAQSLGLAGVELPALCARTLDSNAVALVRHSAERAGISIVLSTFGTDPEALDVDIKLASALGAKVIVTALSETRFGGDRRHLAGCWVDLLNAVQSRIAAVIGTAESRGVVIGLENHQDLDSGDLLKLCGTIDSEAFGVTFDCANALGIAEHPVEFLRAVSPWVVHAHLKDYRAQWVTDGYALVRCPIGDGVVPFADLVPALDRARPGICLSVETGALVPRVVRIFMADFWNDHRARSPEILASFLGFVGRTAEQPDTDLRTPFELGKGFHAIVEFENQQLERSLQFLQSNLGRWL